MGTQLSAVLTESGCRGRDVLQAAAALAPFPLFPSQEALTTESGILRGESAVCIAPTGSGKSLIGDAAVLKALDQRRAAVVLVPTRALARERAEQLAIALGPAGFRVAASSRDDRTSDIEIEGGRVDVVVAVYEKARSLWQRSPLWRQCVGTIVADELQVIGDPERGPAAELLLTLWRRFSPSVQIVGLSSAPWVQHIAPRLGCGVHHSKHRPQNLRVGIANVESRRLVYSDGDIPEEILEGESTEAAVWPLLQKLPKPAIVFCPTRRQATQLVSLICDHLPFAQTQVQFAEQNAMAGALRDLASRGVGLHTAEMTRQQRREVEAALHDGELSVCVATTTLGEGVNIGVRSVVVMDCTTSHLSMAYGNLIGRAGRPGTGDGTAVIVVDGDQGEARVRRALSGEGSVASGRSASIQTRLECLAHLLAAGLSARSQVELLYSQIHFLSGTLDQTQSRGEALGLWHTHAESLKLTPLGQLFSVGGVPAETLSGCRTLLRRFPEGGGDAAMLFLALGGGESCQRLSLAPEERTSARWVIELCDLLAGDPSPLARWFYDYLWENRSLPRRHHQSAKAVLLLLAVQQGREPESLELEFGIAAGVIETLAENWLHIIRQIEKLDEVNPEFAFAFAESYQQECPSVDASPATQSINGAIEPEPALLIRHGSAGLVSFGGCEVKLSRLQFRMLELLAKCGRDGAPYERIERSVWPDAHVERQQVGFHRRRLEARLQQAASWPKQIVETIPCWGLRLTIDPAQVTFENVPGEGLVCRAVRAGLNSVARAITVQV